jgi:hypothetical protein
MGPGNEDVMYLSRRGLKKEKAFSHGTPSLQTLFCFSHMDVCTSAASQLQNVVISKKKKLQYVAYKLPNST